VADRQSAGAPGLPLLFDEYSKQCSWSPSLLELLETLLCFDAAKRASANGCARSAWLVEARNAKFTAACTKLGEGVRVHAGVNPKRASAHGCARSPWLVEGRSVKPAAACTKLEGGKRAPATLPATLSATALSAASIAATSVSAAPLSAAPFAAALASTAVATAPLAATALCAAALGPARYPAVYSATRCAALCSAERAAVAAACTELEGEGPAPTAAARVVEPVFETPPSSPTTQQRSLSASPPREALGSKRRRLET